MDRKTDRFPSFPAQHHCHHQEREICFSMAFVCDCCLLSMAKRYIFIFVSSSSSFLPTSYLPTSFPYSCSSHWYVEKIEKWSCLEKSIELPEQVACIGVWMVGWLAWIWMNCNCPMWMCFWKVSFALCTLRWRVIKYCFFQCSNEIRKTPTANNEHVNNKVLKLKTLEKEVFLTPLHQRVVKASKGKFLVLKDKKNRRWWNLKFIPIWEKIIIIFYYFLEIFSNYPIKDFQASIVIKLYEEGFYF